jgi:tRNA uridine 5-carbamoylmethylation protein Kti12
VKLVVCGPPGSGKTTISLQLERRLEDAGYDFRVIHTDDLRTPKYQKVFGRLQTFPNANWLLDGTFYKRQWQERVRRFPDARFVLVTADRDTCIRRNWEREDGIPEDAAKTIYDEFDWPDADFTVDTDVLSVEEAVEVTVERVTDWLAEAEAADP